MRFLLQHDLQQQCHTYGRKHTAHNPHGVIQPIGHQALHHGAVLGSVVNDQERGDCPDHVEHHQRDSDSHQPHLFDLSLCGVLVALMGKEHADRVLHGKEHGAEQANGNGQCQRHGRIITARHGKRRGDVTGHGYIRGHYVADCLRAHVHCVQAGADHHAGLYVAENQARNRTRNQGTTQTEVTANIAKQREHQIGDDAKQRDQQCL